MKRLIALIGVFTLLAAPARAGDFAERGIIGFSPDGAYFAFEEYGVQDGSGFPYSNIYVIDVMADSWLPGSPFRTTLQDETADILDARGQTLQKAETMLVDKEIGQEGETVVTRRLTDISGNQKTIRFLPRNVLPPIDAEYEVKIDSFKVRDREMCYDTGSESGYVLTLTKDGGIPLLLHEDTNSIPESRACAQDYRVHDVITFYPQGGEPVLVVIVQMLRTGFEGLDGRFLAVTGTLPQ